MSITIRKYEISDEKGWVYCKALSYLFSPFFDDMETNKPKLLTEIFEQRIEYVAEIDNVIVGLIDIDIYHEENSLSYLYAPSKKTAYFTNLAVHPDYQNLGIAQKLYEKVLQQLKKCRVEKLSIFTRGNDKVNHLYQKWGGKLVCKSYLVVGKLCDSESVYFSVDLAQQKIQLTNKSQQVLPFELREGIYIVTNQEDLSLFDSEKVYEELTYVIDL